MRRILIITFISFLATASAQSQFYKGFGFKGGVSIANQVSEYNNLAPTTISFTNNSGNVYWYYYKIGFTAGIFKEINITQKLKSQIGINYSRKGYSQKIYANIESSKYYYFHNNLDFITAELYGKYNLLNSKINPYILAGVRMDFFISQKSFYRTPDGDEDSNNSTFITNNKIFGTSLGLGLEFPVTNLYTMFLECTYNPDISFITNVDNHYYYHSYYNGYEYNSESHWNYKLRGQSFDIRTGIKF
jgi:hypothetical protein